MSNTTFIEMYVSSQWLLSDVCSRYDLLANNFFSWTVWPQLLIRRKLVTPLLWNCFSPQDFIILGKICLKRFYTIFSSARWSFWFESNLRFPGLFLNNRQKRKMKIQWQADWWNPCSPARPAPLTINNAYLCENELLSCRWAWRWTFKTICLLTWEVKVLIYVLNALNQLNAHCRCACYPNFRFHVITTSDSMLFQLQIISTKNGAIRLFPG